MAEGIRQDEESLLAVPIEYGVYMCRMYTFAAAITETDESHSKVMKAQEALNAARETGNAELEAAAESHHQAVLKMVMQDPALEPVVYELNRRFFASELDGAPHA